MAEIVLVRHAEASGQQPGATLTLDGQRQARLLTPLLLSLDVQRVISSPFTRAVQSIQPFCTHAGIPLETDDRLTERVLSGRDLPDWREHLRRSFDDMDICLEGGESSRAAQNRAAAVVYGAMASAGRCVLVTHGNLLTLILRWVDQTVGFDQWSKLSTPDAFLLHIDAAGPRGFTRIWR